MGTTESKSTEDIQNDSSESNMPSVPISTPQIRKLDWDPRSPSSDIARTPIEVLRTPIASSDATPTNNSLNITEDLNDNNTILAHLNPLDPRSPTTEFHRTPIITDAVLKLQTLHNKNLDKVRAPFVSITPLKPRKISERVVKKIYNGSETDSIKIVSPKLLESSPILIKPSENKRHSVVGLLETNIDFIETDLDKVIQSKIHNKIENQTVLETHTDVAFITTVNQSNKIEIPVETILEGSENIEDHTNIIIHNEIEIPSPVTTASEPSNEEINSSSSESDYEEDPVQETCLFSMKTDKLNEMIQEVNKISTEIKNGSIVNELDRKLTNLIYEDKQSELSPKPTKPIDNNHTPLRNRNMNSQQPKSIPQLKVSDKPTKPSGGVSRIPVFKEKRLNKGKINIQCENTPPRIKSKRSQWDIDDSIII